MKGLVKMILYGKKVFVFLLFVLILNLKIGKQIDVKIVIKTVKLALINLLNVYHVMKGLNMIVKLYLVKNVMLLMDHVRLYGTMLVCIKILKR